MNISDLIKIGLANLWQTKLRSILTILGVVIGIAALSSMVSFGTGIQKNITDAFANNDLFTSMNVTPTKIDLEELQNPSPEALKRAKESKKIPLTDSVLKVIKGIEGVALAHPEIIIPGKLSLGEMQEQTRIQALPPEIGRYKPYKDLIAGSFFSSDTAREIVLRWEALKNIGLIIKDEENEYTMTRSDSAKGKQFASADTLIGKNISLITATINIERITKNPFSMISGKSSQAFGEDTTVLTIAGILERSNPFSTGNLKGGAIIPSGIASSIPTVNFSSIWDILDESDGKDQYSSIYVRVNGVGDLDRVRKAIEEMGLHVFTISDQLAEIKRGFLIMDAILGAIGVVALLIATLGIINTMVMSILERTREIGIMKAIGGSDREIRTIFFVEAGAIGLIGATFGLILGWLFTKVANLVINNYIIGQNETPVDLFYFPIWLIAGAITFSVLLSLAAGLYPASRAVRIDPVKALRHD